MEQLVLSMEQASSFIKVLYETNQIMKKCNKETVYFIDKGYAYANNDLYIVKSEIKTNGLDDIFNKIYNTKIIGSELFRWYNDNKNNINEITIESGNIYIEAAKSMWNTNSNNDKSLINKINSIMNYIDSNQRLESISYTDEEILNIATSRKIVKIDNKVAKFRFSPSFIIAKPVNPLKKYSIIDFFNPKKAKTINKYLYGLKVEDIDSNNKDQYIENDEMKLSIKPEGVNIVKKSYTNDIGIYDGDIDDTKFILWKQPNKNLDLTLIFKILSR